MRSVFRRAPSSRLSAGALVRQSNGWTGHLVADDFFEWDGITHDGQVSMSASGGFSSTGQRRQAGSAIFQGASWMQQSANRQAGGFVQMAAESGLSASGGRMMHGQASMSGQSGMSSLGGKSNSAGSSMQGLSSMSLSGIRSAGGGVSMSGQSVVAAAAQKIMAAVAVIEGLGSMAVSASRANQAAALMSGLSGFIAAAEDDGGSMAQVNPAAFQITRFSGMNNSTWTEVKVPPGMPVCRKVVIYNPSANAIQVTTDPDDPSAVDSIPSGGSYAITLLLGMFQGGSLMPTPYGDVVCLIKGPGPQQPLILFSA
jgi:hypothetical protein